jgi:protein involved in polysaccharide export with SLBB domain
MTHSQRGTGWDQPRSGGPAPFLPVVLAVLFGAASGGCAAITNPVADGVPVRRLPPELLGHSKDDSVTIPMTFLEQKRPDAYRLDAGDILGVYIEGVLGAERPRPGEAPAPPPIHFPESVWLNPSFGYPIQVRENGTLALPLVPPVPVRNLTVDEAQAAVARAYVDAKVIQPGRERLLVSLVRPRTYRVTVIRQEVGGFNSGPQGIAGLVLTGGTSKRGSGHVVDLPAYQNDVLNALSRTGGLPGLDACNEVVVMRGPSDSERMLLEAEVQRGDPAQLRTALARLSCPVVKIPLRARPCDVPPPRPEDILLSDGDVVLLEAREFDRFYAGGLLPAGEYVLPRDHDLDVVEAVSLLRGPLVSGNLLIAGGGNAPSSEQPVPPALSPTVAAVVPTGFGAPGPSLLTVLRHTPHGRVVPIRVDLNRALCDPRESLIVQPRDVLILQETPCEAVARYVSQLFNFTFFYDVFQGGRGRGTINGAALVASP